MKHLFTSLIISLLLCVASLPAVAETRNSEEVSLTQMATVAATVMDMVNEAEAQVSDIDTHADDATLPIHGQPLPGVALTLMLGSMLWSFLKRRHGARDEEKEIEAVVIAITNLKLLGYSTGSFPWRNAVCANWRMTSKLRL